MGCPVPKVAVKSQAGSALLKNPEKIGKIVKAVTNAVNAAYTYYQSIGGGSNE